MWSGALGQFALGEEQTSLFQIRATAGSYAASGAGAVLSFFLKAGQQFVRNLAPTLDRIRQTGPVLGQVRQSGPGLTHLDE
jgi:hypothetical protein